MTALKHHRWLDKDTGEISPRPRRAGRPKTLHSLGYELFKILEVLTHPNFSLRVLFLECDEFRALDGRGKSRRIGATLLGKIPLGIMDDITLSGKDAYGILLPDGLESSFSAKDYLRAIGSRSRYDTYNLRLLCELGFVRRAGKNGNAYVYELL